MIVPKSHTRKGRHVGKRGGGEGGAWRNLRAKGGEC